MKRPADLPARLALCEEIVDAIFPHPRPGRLASFLATQAAAEHLESFALNPVVRIGGDRHRLAISDIGRAPAEWIADVARAWPQHAVDGFFAQMPGAPRRMVDTDGEGAVFYLDDLQQNGAALPDGASLMSCTLSTTGETTVITRPGREQASLPRELEPLRRRLAGAGVSGGVWAVRWRNDDPLSLLWISESRYSGNAVATAALIGALGGASAWQSLRAAAEARGFIAYPDVLEISGQGVDATIGFVAKH
jgi:hypothetical protein